MKGKGVNWATHLNKEILRDVFDTVYSTASVFKVS